MGRWDECLSMYSNPGEVQEDLDRIIDALETLTDEIGNSEERLRQSDDWDADKYLVEEQLQAADYLNDIRKSLKRVRGEIDDAMGQALAALRSVAPSERNSVDGYYTSVAALVPFDGLMKHVAGNPSVVVEQWGELRRLFYHGADACVGCGEAARHTVISGASVPLCNTCKARWLDLGAVTEYLASALALRGNPTHLPLPLDRTVTFLNESELRSRDGGVCRLCGAVESADVPLEAGHILSRHDAYGREDGRAWNVPKVYANHPLNIALMCKPCNASIGSASPSLRVGMHLLLKPWTVDPAGEALLATRLRSA